MWRSSLLAATLATLAAGAAVGRGQAREGDLEGRFLQQQRLIDDKLRQERAEEAPLDRLLDFQWGGWLEYYSFNFNDGVQSSRNVQRPGLSVWTRLRLDDGAH